MNESTDYIPVGTILPLGRPLADDETNFLLCDGRSLTSEAFPELFATIGYLYGGDQTLKKFNLPDTRGLFLRGADRGAGVDPDAATRKFLSPTPPAQTDIPGGYQAYATQLPGNPFNASVPNLPANTLGAHGATSKHHTEVKGAKTIDTCTSGGDGDTRPVNVYVEFYIKAKS